MKNLKEKLNDLMTEHARLFSDPSYVFYAGVGAFFIMLASLVNFYAGQYATQHASVPATDFFLSILPLVPWASTVHLATFIIIPLIILVPILILPRYLPFIFISNAILALIRSLFINLTHVGIYPDAHPIVISGSTFGGDLFFSGHVAYLFLSALILWEYRWARYTLFFFSFLFGLNTLLGHLHYSIDVFAAPFITFGVYHLSIKLFPRCYQLTRREREAELVDIARDEPTAVLS